MKVRVYNSLAGSSFFQRLVAEIGRLVGSSEIVSALTNKTYRKEHGRIGRYRLRGRMYAGILVKGLLNSPSKADVVVATTNPFCLPALVILKYRRRGIKTICLLYDLYPEALIHSGKIRAGSLSARLLAHFTRKGLQQADAVVFLGERLKEHAIATYGPIRRGVVIPVGANEVGFEDALVQRGEPQGPVRLLYCGQMGHLHDWETLAAALRKVLGSSKSGISVKFHSFGAGFQHLRQELEPMSLFGVGFGGALSDADWRRKMLAADVAVVTMKPGSEQVLLPSKVYSAMMAGQAILAICPAQSDLASLIHLHECGWVVEPGAVEELCDLLRAISVDPSQIKEKQENAFVAGHRAYSVSATAQLWAELLSSETTSAFKE